MTADLVFDEMSQCLAKVFAAQQTIHVPRTLDSEHFTVALDDTKSEEADIVTITLSPQPHVIAIWDTNPAIEGFATPSVPSIIADPTMLFALIESALEYENLSNEGKVFDKPPQRNDDDSLSPFIYKESFFISHSSRDCLMPLVAATFFGNEQFTGDALKLSTHNDPNRRELFGTLEKYDLLLVAYGKPWWLRGNFGLHVRNWFDTGKLIVLVGGTRSTHSVHFLVYLNIASSEFCRNMLVKLCRDNEQVFRTNYIAASWHDRPLGVVKVDFHHAVKYLLSYNFFLDFNSSAAFSGGNLNLGDVLNDKVWYSWGGHSKDITRQVILFSSCIFVALDFTKTVLTGASENRVSKEFVFLMQNSSHLDALAGTNKFKLIPNAFSVLVQNWLSVMQEELEEYLHAHFVFRSHLLGSRNQPYCNWCSRFNQIINEFIPLYFLHIS
ncbi:hypothetical protein RND71_011645 [Anisodus tanguticus]|uniref:Uncharacterized protein n=1 Tax=Anisodus tanguticus TaxID=243964 RepID=A0AAE1VF95_9SOLA|nr:hypothetical protein RND71_011645 [Anisodus tanguticus]